MIPRLIRVPFAPSYHYYIMDGNVAKNGKFGILLMIPARTTGKGILFSGNNGYDNDADHSR